MHTSESHTQLVKAGCIHWTSPHSQVNFIIITILFNIINLRSHIYCNSPVDSLQVVHCHDYPSWHHWHVQIILLCNLPWSSTLQQWSLLYLNRSCISMHDNYDHEYDTINLHIQLWSLPWFQYMNCGNFVVLYILKETIHAKEFNMHYI